MQRPVRGALRLRTAAPAAGKILRCMTVLYIFLSASITSSLAETLKVRADTVESLKIEFMRSAPAEVSSLRQATIASELTTTITRISVLVGQRLSQGDTIAELECTDNELALAQSEANMGALSASRTLARQQLARLNKLRASNNASEEAINQKQAELSSVNARINAQQIAIKINRRQVVKCTVVAPYPGIIIERFAESGDFVSPGTPLATILDDRNIELVANLSPDELEQSISAKEREFLYQGISYPVQIRTSVAAIDTISQTRQLRLSFPSRRPLTGATGRLQWTLHGTFLPAALGVVRKDQRGIFVVETRNDQTVARFSPVANTKPGQPIPVDLAPHTKVITDGRFGLQDNQVVEIDE